MAPAISKIEVFKVSRSAVQLAYLQLSSEMNFHDPQEKSTSKEKRICISPTCNFI